VKAQVPVGGDPQAAPTGNKNTSTVANGNLPNVNNENVSSTNLP
jgi:hypothetical protein